MHSFSKTKYKNLCIKIVLNKTTEKQRHSKRYLLSILNKLGSVG